jgi:hypothetical protein
MPRAAVRLAVCVALVIAAVSGVWLASRAGSSGSLQPAHNNSGTVPIKATSALSVSQVPIPPLPVANYLSKGTYPSVSARGKPLTAVDASLRNAVLEFERQYAASARRNVHHCCGRGDFWLFSDQESLSASTVVVSALIPTLQLYPGGNDGEEWFSATVQVPSGQSVNISDLFANQSRGLGVLAKVVKQRVLATNSCVRTSVDDPTVGRFMAAGFNPTSSNYRYFALSTSGLVIGFVNSQVAYPTCGRISATVPYRTLQPYLSKLGQRLVSGVRHPRS